MKRFDNESTLLEQLADDVASKDTVMLMGGSFPLLYTTNRTIEAIDYWAPFTRYSLELACAVGRDAREQSKRVKFVFFVDDHSYATMMQLKPSVIEARKRELYQMRSGPNAQLNLELSRILADSGFCEEDVIRQGDCLLFSEQSLMDSPQDSAHVAFLDNPMYFDKNSMHPIAFILQRCDRGKCNTGLAVDGLSASRVFMPFMPPLSNEEDMFSKGVTYRKD